MSSKTGSIFALFAIVCVATTLVGGYNADDSWINEEAIEELETNFEDIVVRKFWERQKAASELEEDDSYVLQNLSNLFAKIEYTKYAIVRDGFERTNKILKELERKQVVLEQSGLTMDNELLDLLNKRAVLRILVGSFVSTEYKWKLLHKLIKHYVGKASKSQIRTMAMDVLDERVDFGSTTEEAYHDQLMALEDVILHKKVHGLKGERILADLDTIIDESIGCPKCTSQAEPDELYYDAYPMYAPGTNLGNLAKQYVDAKLLDAVKSSEMAVGDQVIKFDPSEVEALDLEDLAFYEHIWE